LGKSARWDLCNVTWGCLLLEYPQEANKILHMVGLFYTDLIVHMEYLEVQACMKMTVALVVDQLESAATSVYKQLQAT